MRVAELDFSQVEFHVSRCRRGYRSVAALAEDVGLSRGYVAQIARGLVPPPETRAKLAAALGVAESEIWQARRDASSEAQAGKEAARP